MKFVVVTIEGTSPYSASRQHDTPKLDKETADAHEARTWREKCTYDANGIVHIPAMAFKQSLDTAAKRFSGQIPGKGKATYTKNFLAGVLCESDMSIGIKKADAPGITLSCNSDGVRGSGKRVKRTFPQFAQWQGQTRFVVLDDTVTPAVFEEAFKNAGRYVGVGRFRPENGGVNGRFVPVKFEWGTL